MSRNPKADVPYVAPTPEALIQAEYNRMNDDEKKRHNLARSQRVEPTDPITPLIVSGPILRNGLQRPPPTPTPQEEALEMAEEPASPSGVVLGMVVGMGVAVALYLGVTRFLFRSSPLVIVQ